MDKWDPIHAILDFLRKNSDHLFFSDSIAAELGITDSESRYYIKILLNDGHIIEANGVPAGSVGIGYEPSSDILYIRRLYQQKEY